MLKYGQVLEQAPCCQHTAINSTKVTNLIADPGRQKAFQAQSAISFKRALAGSPLRDQEMRDMVYKEYAVDKAAGLITGDEPEGYQIWNLDEMGVKPDGNGGHTFTLGSMGERPFGTQTGEHNEFWVTVCFGSRADGEMSMPPVVVHQGGSETEMPANFSLYLDASFGIHATPSGYMNRVGFRAVAEQFVKFAEPRADRPQYLFIDGHDSHFDYEALCFLIENHVRVFFLKSNDSINDQPQDNGMNKCLRSYYDKRYNQWKARTMVVPYSPVWFNKVFTVAWNDYLSNPKLPQLIRTAFQITNLYPMPKKVDSESMSVQNRAKLCEAFLQSDSERNAIQQYKGEFETMDALVKSSYSEVKAVSVMELENVVTPEGDRHTFRVVVDAALMKTIQTSHIMPAQELRDVLAEAGEGKGVRVEKGALGCCQNPSTVTGLACTATTMERIEEARNNRNTKLNEKAERAEATKAKNNDKIVQQNAAKEQLIGVLTDDPTAWPKLNKALLELCFKALGGKGTHGKKEELILALEPMIEKLLGEI